MVDSGDLDADPTNSLLEDSQAQFELADDPHVLEPNTTNSQLEDSQAQFELSDNPHVLEPNTTDSELDVSQDQFELADRPPALEPEPETEPAKDPMSRGQCPMSSYVERPDLSALGLESKPNVKRPAMSTLEMQGMNDMEKSLLGVLHVSSTWPCGSAVEKLQVSATTLLTDLVNLHIADALGMFDKIMSKFKELRHINEEHPIKRNRCLPAD